jgi:uncharacterized protein (TIGR03067 family)
MDGQKMSGGGARIVVQGNRFTSIAMGATYEGTVELDETTAPKRFDLHFDEGPEKGNRSLGIYELDGDTWKICLTTRGSERRRVRRSARRGCWESCSVGRRMKRMRRWRRGTNLVMGNLASIWSAVDSGFPSRRAAIGWECTNSAGGSRQWTESPQVRPQVVSRYGVDDSPRR